MKKGLLAGLAFFMILLSACGKETVVIDPSQLAESLLTELSFDDELQPIDASMAEQLYGIDDAVSIQVWMGSGATAEEIAVLELPDEDSAKAAEQAALDRVTAQKTAFSDYVPAEVARLEQAVVERKGNYVILCVSNEPEKAREMIEKSVQ